MVRIEGVVQCRIQGVMRCRIEGHRCGKEISTDAEQRDSTDAE